MIAPLKPKAPAAPARPASQQNQTLGAAKRRAPQRLLAGQAEFLRQRLGG